MGKARRVRIAYWRLQQRQSLPLDLKVQMTEKRIRAWYAHWCGNVFVALAGKDSTVLLHIVRGLFPDVPAVFVNTGLEFPEIVEAAKAENAIIVRPRTYFPEVKKLYGYPVVSKTVSRYVWDLRRPAGVNDATKHLRRTGINRAGVFCPSMRLPQKWLFLIDAPFLISDKCCHIMKREPLAQFQKETDSQPMTGVMAGDSRTRERTYLRWGCNNYKAKSPVSSPLGFWTEQDVLAYIQEHNVTIAKVYGRIVAVGGRLQTTGEHRTGCIFCAFGAHLEEEPNRFQRLKRTHPKLWRHAMDKLGMRAVLDFVGVPYA